MDRCWCGWHGTVVGREYLSLLLLKTSQGGAMSKKSVLCGLPN